MTIQEYGRNSIPDILLQNRFLRLFSEDMDNPEAFVERPSSISCDGKVVYAMGKNRAIYSYFSLALPENSKVYRHENEIVIEMPLAGFAGASAAYRAVSPSHWSIWNTL